MQPQSAGAKWGPTSMGMESHIAAGLSYLTPVAGLIFFLMEKTNRFVRFHAMQSIILGVGYIIWFIVIGIILPIILGVAGGTADAATGNTGAFGLGGSLLSCGLVCLSWVGGLAFFAGWLWGIISAFTGKYTKLPVIGNLAEKWAGGPAQPAF
jgi:uncharacterized membrane protein